MTDKHKYKIKQDFTYEPSDWWSWSVWVEGKSEDLDLIDRVVYTLHSTFSNPVRTIDTRKNKFKLETAGWGTFVIYINIILKNNTSIKLDHELVLKYPDGTITNA